MVARRSLILLCVAAGMMLVALEVRFMHRSVISEYPQANIPIVYGFVAMVAALVALVRVPLAQGVAAVVLAAGAPIGLIGLQNHTEGRLAPIMQVISGTASVRESSEEEEEGGGREEEEQPPALAPLGLAGLGLIGALAAWPESSRKKSTEPSGTA